MLSSLVQLQFLFVSSNYAQNSSNYDAVTKELRGDVLWDEVPTDIAIRSFTTENITIHSAKVICNQNRENLDVFMKIYQQDNTENARDDGRNYEAT